MTTTLTFRVPSEHYRKIEIEKGIRIHHAYPTIASYLAGQFSDWEDVNPRSHGENMLEGFVPSAIKETITDDPLNFYLANRGVTILAQAVHYEKESQECTIEFTDKTLHGVVDGGTTNAVVAALQRQAAKDAAVSDYQSLSPEQIPPEHLQARIHLEIIVNVEKFERIKILASGRNTSKQVKQFSLADFGNEFQWIKNELEKPKGKFKGKVGYEENATADIDVREVLSILTLFHPDYDERGTAPTVAYSSKGVMDRRMVNPKTAPGYKSLAPIMEDILDLHDYVYLNFENAYLSIKKNGKLVARGSKENRIFPRRKEKLPLSGKEAECFVPNGVLYPLLAALRALVSHKSGQAKWLLDPKNFFTNFGHILVGTLFDHFENSGIGGNPQTLGKTKSVYTALHNEARLLLLDKIEP